MADYEIVHAWLTKAVHDLDTAKIISARLPDYDDMIAFHCQQAIEKSFKGYLVFLDTEFKAVHDLGYLLNLIIDKDPSLDSYFDVIDRISGYAVQIRYPETIIRISHAELKEALNIADEIFNVISEKTGHNKV